MTQKNQAVSISDLVTRAKRKFELMQYVEQLITRLDDGSIDPAGKLFVALTQAFEHILGIESVSRVCRIDLEPFCRKIEANRNLEYLETLSLFYQMLCENRVTAGDFLRRGMLPNFYRGLAVYLGAIRGMKLSDVLAMTRAAHYATARQGNLEMTEDVLDDLDAMFTEVLGLGLESKRSDILDTFRVSREVLDASLELTRSMADEGSTKSR